MLRAELGLTWNDVVHEISYQNLIMLAQCTPSYFRDEDKTVKKGNVTQKVLAKGQGQDLMASVLARRGIPFKMSENGSK